MSSDSMLDLQERSLRSGAGPYFSRVQHAQWLLLPASTHCCVRDGDYRRDVSINYSLLHSCFAFVLQRIMPKNLYGCRTTLLRHNEHLSLYWFEQEDSVDAPGNWVRVTVRVGFGFCHRPVVSSLHFISCAQQAPFA